MFGWEIAGERKKKGMDRKNFKVFPFTLHVQEIYALDSELSLLVKFSRLKVLIFLFPNLETGTKCHVKKKQREMPAK